VDARTWIVLADAASARMYAPQANGRDWTLAVELSHPQGRAKESELGRDKPGRDKPPIGRSDMNLRTVRPDLSVTRFQPCARPVGGGRHRPYRRRPRALQMRDTFLAAVGHAAIAGAAVLFLGSSYPVADLVPWGSHPAVDGLFSSQRVTLVHDGSRFSRLQKVCDLASWPTALAALRVCPEGLGMRANCGECEKCLRTRLELLAAGVEETEAFGPSLTPSELWNEAIPGPIGDRAIFYEDLIGPLRARGLDAICRVLEEKIRAYRAQASSMSPRTRRT